MDYRTTGHSHGLQDHMTQSWNTEPNDTFMTTGPHDTVMDYRTTTHSHGLQNHTTQSRTTGPQDTVMDYRTTGHSYGLAAISEAQ